MSETPTRRSGHTPLRGRPLDENGAIQFEPTYPVDAVRLAYENGKRDQLAADQPWMRAAVDALERWVRQFDGQTEPVPAVYWQTELETTKQLLGGLSAHLKGAE